jgi:hypothetical protein
MNRYYFRSYKIFPYKIDINNEEMICRDYFFSKKVIKLKLLDITKITGGIFSGYPSRPIYLFDEKNTIKVGINQHIKNYNSLLTIILKNVNQKLYNELLETMKDNVKIRDKNIFRMNKDRK